MEYHYLQNEDAAHRHPGSRGYAVCAVGAHFQAWRRSRSRRGKRPRPPDELPRSDLRVDRTEVLVPVAVNDTFNRPVAGLEKENFRVFDDKIEQAITSFSMEDEPVAVGLVFDTSGSMSGAEREERMAATEFFKTANPEDEFALVEFDSAPRLVVPVTPDPAKITYQLLFTHTKGLDRAAGCRVPGTPRDQEIQQEAQGAGGDLRRGREQQPLYVHAKSRM